MGVVFCMLCLETFVFRCRFGVLAVWRCVLCFAWRVLRYVRCVLGVVRFIQNVFSRRPVLRVVCCALRVVCCVLVLLVSF